MKSSELKQIIVAIMYGDCHVQQNHNSGKARLDIYHTTDNYDLILYKMQILESVTGIRCTLAEKQDNRKLKSGKVRKGYRLITNFSRYLYKLFNAPFKYVAKQLVKPMALAIMWQDDGSVSWHKNHYSTATLATDDWEEWKVQELRKAWNNQHGWAPHKMDYKCRGVDYLRLRFVKDMYLKLTAIIGEFVVPSMQYKITFKTLGEQSL